MKKIFETFNSLPPIGQRIIAALCGCVVLGPSVSMCRFAKMSNNPLDITLSAGLSCLLGICIGRAVYCAKESKTYWLFGAGVALFLLLAFFPAIRVVSLSIAALIAGAIIELIMSSRLMSDELKEENGGLNVEDTTHDEFVDDEMIPILTIRRNTDGKNQS